MSTAKFTMFRVVAPRKAKKFNNNKVWFPHPTDCMAVVPSLAPNFSFDGMNKAMVVINDNLVELMVYKRGTDYYILENEYIQAQKVVAR